MEFNYHNVFNEYYPKSQKILDEYINAFNDYYDNSGMKLNYSTAIEYETVTSKGEVLFRLHFSLFLIDGNLRYPNWRNSSTAIINSEKFNKDTIKWLNKPFEELTSSKWTSCKLEVESDALTLLKDSDLDKLYSQSVGDLFILGMTSVADNPLIKDSEGVIDRLMNSNND